MDWFLWTAFRLLHSNIFSMTPNWECNKEIINFCILSKFLASSTSLWSHPLTHPLSLHPMPYDYTALCWATSQRRRAKRHQKLSEPKQSQPRQQTDPVPSLQVWRGFPESLLLDVSWVFWILVWRGKHWETENQQKSPWPQTPIDQPNQFAPSHAQPIALNKER